MTEVRRGGLKRRALERVGGSGESWVKVSLAMPRASTGGENLKADALIHWRINCQDASGYGSGVLRVLLHTLLLQSDKRPSFMCMKAKTERTMPKIFEK